MDNQITQEFGQGQGELFECQYNKPLPMRLDRWLVSQRSEQSRAHIQKFIEAGFAKVNGKNSNVKCTTGCNQSKNPVQQWNFSS